jgi:hypothetical protein
MVACNTGEAADVAVKPVDRRLERQHPRKGFGVARGAQGQEVGSD